MPKRTLRTQALAVRRVAHGLLGDGAGPRIADSFFTAVPWAKGNVVGGYWPIGEEADVRPLLERLRQAGCVIALPAVTAPDAPLSFRRWVEGEALEPGPHGTRQPGGAAPELRPDILLIPLLAFDRTGARLGYGGGYYDRTLTSLRSRTTLPVVAVGIAYGQQEVASVPWEEHDQRLDWIVTEDGALKAAP